MKSSVISQILLLVYFQLCQWVPLGRWNDQPETVNDIFGLSLGAVATPLSFAVAQLLFIFAYFRRIAVLMWLGLVFYAGWFALQLLGWWVPYIWGASDEHMQMYDRVFGRTYKFLPSFANHPAPDAMHTVVHGLLLFVLLTLILRVREPESVAQAR